VMAARAMLRTPVVLASIVGAYVAAVILIPGGGEALEAMPGASLSGLEKVLSFPALAYQLLGIAIGFFVGILPGLGGPVTLALMLGFVFELKMAPVEAFSFLLGMAAVTSTTGDITSVLFGIPGEAVTASTVVDGHPMAKKGEAGRALGAALMSSLVGAVFGALAIVVAIPLVRPLVLAFGSPEFFMIVVLGVTYVGALSGGNVIKGLVAGGLGFLFSMVGLDPQSGTQRFTFGQLYLWEGIGLVPVTVGLFAIPEIIDLAVKGGAIAQEKVGRLGGVMQGVKDTFIHWWLVIRCSAIGTYIGIIPGMGAGVSQWLAYAYAIQASPRKEEFGTGRVEGVLGPGAANNSGLGGALIPTVAFGVPGSVSTAILLGAFLILGLQPGPRMLDEKLDITMSLVWIIITSNIITVGLCFLFLNQLARLTQIRGALLIPPLLLLVYIGSYTNTNNFGDIIVTLVFGLLGWLMILFGWPRPSLLLGLVLGRLGENYLFLATSRYGLDWLGRPGVIGLFVLALAGVMYPVVERRLRQRRPGSGGGDAAGAGSS